MCSYSDQVHTLPKHTFNLKFFYRFRTGKMQSHSIRFALKYVLNIKYSWGKKCAAAYKWIIYIIQMTAATANQLIIFFPHFLIISIDNDFCASQNTYRLSLVQTGYEYCISLAQTTQYTWRFFRLIAMIEH